MNFIFARRIELWKISSINNVRPPHVTPTLASQSADSVSGVRYPLRKSSRPKEIHSSTRNLRVGLNTMRLVDRKVCSNIHSRMNHDGTHATVSAMYPIQ